MSLSKDKKYADFIGFSYGEFHSSQLGLYRVTSGDRYEEDLSTAFSDNTIQVQGRDGTLLFGTDMTKKEININFAFDEVDEEQFFTMKTLFSEKKLQKLIFDESPYKYYWVKPASPPSVKYLCFNRIKKEGKVSYEERVYKGEGSLKLVCYEGFGRSTYLDLSSDVLEVNQYIAKLNKNSQYILSNFPTINNSSNILTLVVCDVYGRDHSFEITPDKMVTLTQNAEGYLRANQNQDIPDVPNENQYLIFNDAEDGLQQGRNGDQYYYFDSFLTAPYFLTEETDQFGTFCDLTDEPILDINLSTGYIKTYNHLYDVELRTDEYSFKFYIESYNQSDAETDSEEEIREIEMQECHIESFYNYSEWANKIGFPKQFISRGSARGEYYIENIGNYKTPINFIIDPGDWSSKVITIQNGNQYLKIDMRDCYNDDNMTRRILINSELKIIQFIDYFGNEGGVPNKIFNKYIIEGDFLYLEPGRNLVKSNVGLARHNVRFDYRFV